MGSESDFEPCLAIIVKIIIYTVHHLISFLKKNTCYHLNILKIF